jgi:DNA-binding MarR family transcriptional regulator
MQMGEWGVLTAPGGETVESFDDFVDAVLDLMRAARRTGGAAHTTKGDGISVPQLVVLSAIDSVGERGVSAVADKAGLAQPTVTRALAALERGGMVLRTPHVRDGRTTCLVLTAAGQAVLKDKRRDTVGRFAELWDDLGDDQREQAVHLVRRLSAIADGLT